MSERESLSLLVMERSAWEAVLTPEGWLCARMQAAAFNQAVSNNVAIKAQNIIKVFGKGEEVRAPDDVLVTIFN